MDDARAAAQLRDRGRHLPLGRVRAEGDVGRAAQAALPERGVTQVAGPLPGAGPRLAVRADPVQRRLEQPDDGRRAADERQPLAQRQHRVEPVPARGAGHSEELPVDRQPLRHRDDLDVEIGEQLLRAGLPDEDDELVLPPLRQRPDRVQLGPRIALPRGRDHQAVHTDS